MFMSNFQISYQEIVQYLQLKGVCLQEEFLGYHRENIDGVISFFGTLMTTLLENAKRVYVEVNVIYA